MTDFQEALNAQHAATREALLELAAKAAATIGDGVSPVVCVIAWRTGKLEIAEREAEGSLKLVEGERVVLERALDGCARLAYDNFGWLAPGVPEAESDDQALDALVEFQARLIERVERIEGQSNLDPANPNAVTAMNYDPANHGESAAFSDPAAARAHSTARRTFRKTVKTLINTPDEAAVRAVAEFQVRLIAEVERIEGGRS